MTRDERGALAVRAYADADLGLTHEEAMDAALDAALADVGGLDGLALLADLTDQSRPPEDRKATLVATGYLGRLRADRDRLREALSDVMRDGTDGAFRVARAALDESEAGT